jgi:hypothetical protein
MTQINLIFLFFGWCVTSILVNGSIFDKFRNYLIVTSPFFGKLFSCVMCLSVWIGAALFWPLLYNGYASYVFQEPIPHWFSYLMFPFLQSGVSVIIESVIIFFVKGASKKNF